MSSNKNKTSIQNINAIIADVLLKHQMNIQNEECFFEVIYNTNSKEFELNFNIVVPNRGLIRGSIQYNINFKLDFGSIQALLNPEKNIQIMHDETRKILAKIIEENFDKINKWIGFFNGNADDCQKIAEFLENKY
ncbi:MAG: hypothetical protein ACK452_09895, partial [Bacteroidota bacterium]